jgi:hypothetical protein
MDEEKIWMTFLSHAFRHVSSFSQPDSSDVYTTYKGIIPSMQFWQGLGFKPLKLVNDNAIFIHFEWCVIYQIKP